MQPNFWHIRWAEGRIGFHQQKINSRLKKLWHASVPQKDDTVFLPLCGKSLDMLWFVDNGYRVFGNEISEIACHDFYRENNLPYQAQDRAPFIQFSGERIELWCGDFFDLKPIDLLGIRLVYDRAALIALPDSMRGDYALHLSSLLQSGTQIFLISMDYDESKMEAPPFSVPEADVRELFENHFVVEIIAQSSGPDIVGNLAERGLDTLNEKVYRIVRR